MAKETEYFKLYALCWKDSGAILTPESFKKHWPRYGSVGSGLHGWRPPKKVYYTVGHAKSGFSHIPEEIKSSIEIREFVMGDLVEDGETIQKKQVIAKEKKRIKAEIRSKKWQVGRKEREIEELVNLGGRADLKRAEALEIEISELKTEIRSLES